MLVSRTTTWSVDATCAISGVELGSAVAVQADCTTGEGGGDSAGIGLRSGVSCMLIAGVAVATGVALGKGRGAVADGDGPSTSWQPHSSGSRHKTNKTSGEINTRFIAQRHLSQRYPVYVSTARTGRTRGGHWRGRRSLKLGPLLQLTPRCQVVCAIIGPSGSPEV